MKQPQTNASNHRRVRSEPSISFDQTDSSISPPLSDLTINSTTSSTPSAASSGTTNVSTLESEDEALAHYADTLLTQLDVQLARAQERIKRKGSFATDAKLANLQAMRRQLDERQKFVRSYRSNDSWWSTAQLRTTVLVAKTLLEALRFVPNKL